MEQINWALVFAQSKANGNLYFGEYLQPNKWRWPEGWLTRRIRELEQIKKEQGDE